MRQEALDKLGFTFNAVRQANPRMVYAAAVGFGRHGRYAGKPAYDDVIQAASGFAGLFQMRDGTPLYAPSIAADKVSGIHLAYALMAALLYRERSGEAPGYVEVPMFELMAAFSLSEHLGAATFQEDGKVGYVRVLSPGRRPYKTKDGWVGVLPYSERNWTKILVEIGRQDMVALAWFKNATERSRRVDELYDILAQAMLERTSAEWIATFERLDIPHSPLRSPQELLADPHLNDVGLFACNFAGDTPVRRTLRQAVNVEGVATAPDLPPPPLGADTEVVLREAGCSEAEIAAVMPRHGR
jgi:crotonobetainyl-CoA:carnitine CoA-transferase CaiB-like acyl-CoA transferase